MSEVYTKFLFVSVYAGLDIKVWARADYVDLLKNVSDKIIKSLEILQDFWNIPYPLPKLDCIALPNYQATKPADNWGLILFKYI